MNKFWNREYKEMLAFNLLSRDKIDRRANLHFKMITRTDPVINDFYPLTLQRYKYGFDPTNIFQIIGGKIGFLKCAPRM